MAIFPGDGSLARAREGEAKKKKILRLMSAVHLTRDTAIPVGTGVAMFYRSTTLSHSHYAGRWTIPVEDQRYDLKVVNQLGLEYAKAIDSPEKEARLLKVLECFHGYLMKYVVMIIRGTIPPVGTHAGKDAKELLRTLSPRGAVLDKEQIDRTCKTLHLAFK
jgi:hypothetical protein